MADPDEAQEHRSTNHTAEQRFDDHNDEYRHSRIKQSQRSRIGGGTGRIKEASQIQHRLWSIYRDAQNVQGRGGGTRRWLRRYRLGEQAVSATLSANATCWMVVGNERCGSWYVPPPMLPSTRQGNIGGQSDEDRTSIPPPRCYFKSTDGHVNTWAFSLKRLNLPLLQVVSRDGGVIVVDSSVRKLLPDSFSRTIPIWACVLNRIALRYAQELGLEMDANRNGVHHRIDCAHWNSLFTPACIVDSEEHAKISRLLDDRMETLYKSRAIVHPRQFVEMLAKPLRVLWINHEGMMLPQTSNASGESISTTQTTSDDYFWIVCWNPSRYHVGDNQYNNQNTYDEMVKVTKNHMEWVEDPGYYYTPGAADDHESWARHLTPELFWKHHKTILDPMFSDEQMKDSIDFIVESERIEKQEDDVEPDSHRSSSGSKIGKLNLWVGSRRAGRPPKCWSNFDAILNVTDEEYAGICDFATDDTETATEMSDSKFYLQLPVQEGKRDKAELEKWMPLGLAFLIHHLQRGTRVLVHCAKGRDRSVAVALAFVIVACPLVFPLALRPEFAQFDLKILDFPRAGTDECDSARQYTYYQSSGILSPVAEKLLHAEGKESFMKWVYSQLGSSIKDGILGDKETIRIALHLIRQDREVAEPSRSTMQKVNRFFMSSRTCRS